MWDTVYEIPVNTQFSVIVSKRAFEHFQYLCTFQMSEGKKEIIGNFFCL